MITQRPEDGGCISTAHKNSEFGYESDIPDMLQFATVPHI